MKKKLLSNNLFNRTVSKAVMMLLLITQSAFTVEAATNETIKLATPVLKVTRRQNIRMLWRRLTRSYI